LQRVKREDRRRAKVNTLIASAAGKAQQREYIYHG
jgi:hypothetical protein